MVLSPARTCLAEWCVDFWEGERGSGSTVWCRCSSKQVGAQGPVLEGHCRLPGVRRA